jgi:hypothetical protein
MVATATRPDTQPDTIPGLAYPPEWHRQQELEERAWLDDYARLRLLPVAD